MAVAGSSHLVGDPDCILVDRPDYSPDYSPADTRHNLVVVVGIPVAGSLVAGSLADNLVDYPAGNLGYLVVGSWAVAQERIL